MKDKELKIDETLIEKNFFGITRHSQECINVVKQINQAFKENKSGISIPYTCYDNIDYSFIEFLYKKLLIPMQDIGLIFIAWRGYGFDKFNLYIKWEEIKSEYRNIKYKLYAQMIKFAMKNNRNCVYIPISPFKVYWSTQLQIRTLKLIMQEIPELYNYENLSFDETKLIKDFPDTPTPKYCICKLEWEYKEHFYRSEVVKHLDANKDVIDNLINTLSGKSKLGILHLPKYTMTAAYREYEFANDLQIDFPFHLNLADELKVIRYLEEKIPDYRRFGCYEFRELPKFPYYICKSFPYYCSFGYDKITNKKYMMDQVTHFSFIVVPNEENHKDVFPVMQRMACRLMKRGYCFFDHRCDHWPAT